MKTGIEILGNIKKLALAAVVLMCANVEGWGQAEHVNYVLTFRFTEVKANNILIPGVDYSLTINGTGLDGMPVSVALNDMTPGTVTAETKLWQDVKFKAFNSLTIGFVYNDCSAIGNVEVPAVCRQSMTNTMSAYNGNCNSALNIIAKYEISYTPKEKVKIVRVKDHNNNVIPNETNLCLINDRNITLEAANAGIGGLWEFRNDNISQQKNTSVPAISCSGNGVFGDSFLQMIDDNQPIYVKFNLGGSGNCQSDEIVLHPKLASPTITSIVTTPPSCHGASDGKAVIRFSRAVYNKELLQFAVGGVSNTAHTVSPGSDTFTLTGLSAGIDTIIISGKYPYPPNN